MWFLCVAALKVFEFDLIPVPQRVAASAAMLLGSEEETHFLCRWRIRTMMVELAITARSAWIILAPGTKTLILPVQPKVV
jgi:hypothetical protein